MSIVEAIGCEGVEAAPSQAKSVSVRHGIITRWTWTGCAVAAALVLLGWLRHPQIDLLSVAAAAFVIGAYAVAAAFAGRLLPGGSAAARSALGGGLAAGAIFCAEMVLEYVILPRDNVPYGLVEFGTVWLIYAMVAVVMSARGEPFRKAICAAVAAAMISSIIWCACLLALFFSFEGTARQTSVLLAEGEFDDFRRSGMSSFATFMAEDLFGATFFHLLLGPIIAAILAAGAWSAPRIIARLGRTSFSGS